MNWWLDKIKKEFYDKSIITVLRNQEISETLHRTKEQNVDGYLEKC